MPQPTRGGRLSLGHLFAAARVGVLAFFVLSFASMPLYPGGTFRDRSSVGYRFFSNFFSDLGMPQAWNGAPNPWGALLFVSGETLLAIGLVAFFVGFVTLSSSSPRARGWGRAAAVAGTIVAAALITAGATPANRVEWIHLAAAKLAFRAAFVATACLSLGILRDGRFTRTTEGVAVGMTVLLAAYLGVLEWGPRIRASDYGLTFQATAQKLIVLAVLPAIVFLASAMEAWQDATTTVGLGEAVRTE